MQKPNKKIIAVAILVLADLLFFGRINPENSPSPLLFVAFALLAANFFVLWQAAIRAVELLLGRNQRHKRRLAVIGAGISVVLLALQSIGQLTLRDIIAFTALCGLFWLYLSYYKRKQA
jgi:FlaA1/EpsC-like NDP-sugar epimerase